MIGYYYSPFYFGVIELSSIFLTYVDQFHPKRKNWYEWLHQKHSDDRSMKFKQSLKDMNELMRVLFAMTFLTFRGAYFPYVSLVEAVPDLWKAFENPPQGVPIWTCYVLCGSLVLFSCLQAYWGLFVARQVKKALFGGGKSESGKKTD